MNIAKFLKISISKNISERLLLAVKDRNQTIWIFKKCGQYGFAKLKLKNLHIFSQLLENVS